MSIIYDPKWQQFVEQVEFEGHRLQSKGSFPKMVRNDLCKQMILVIDGMDMYTAEKKTRGRRTSENSLFNKKHELKREKLITKLENLGIGTKLCSGCKLKNFTKFPMCLRCKSDISGVEESGTKLCPGCKLKNFNKFPTCLRCKSEISGVEKSGTKLCPGCKLKNFTRFPTCLRCKSDNSGVGENGCF